jgi:hypothetical protein
MAIHASIILDSGYLSGSYDRFTHDFRDVGYFQCAENCGNVRVYADGTEIAHPRLELGTGNRIIEVVHKSPLDSRRTGITDSPQLMSSLLAMSMLYPGETAAADWDRFDYRIRFYSGRFRPSMVKPRRFKEHRLGTGSSNPAVRNDVGTIAHDIVVDYYLECGDVLTIEANGNKIWSSESAGSNCRKLDIEFLADDSTALKFFCERLEQNKDCYWIPNQGNPPPAIGP